MMKQDEHPPGVAIAAVPLRRLLGSLTIVCVGVGGAIGSGVFRTPGTVATHVTSWWAIILLWGAAGLITLMQSLVSAELATRFPHAGGEYEYLKRAYGPFAAFFFGWSCTIFIIGAGAGTIAAALGDFAAELMRLENTRWASPAFGCAAMLAVAAVNVVGLRTGAATQNALTFLKVAALLGIGIGAWWLSARWLPARIDGPATVAPRVTLEGWMLGLLPVFWSYTGATDAVRLAEEVRDVHRALPRAMIGIVAALTVVYILYNYALLCAVPLRQMAGEPAVHALAFASLKDWPVREGILVASILICLGSISAVLLASARVTFALARDGLAPRVFARMSASQAPVACFVLSALLACAFVMNRDFARILRIYFLASAVLFALTYLTLILFRRRDRLSGRGFPSEAFRAPAGPLLAVLLIVFELVIGVTIIAADVQTWRDPDAPNQYDSIYTIGLLAATAVGYGAWRRFTGARVTHSAS